MNCVECESLTDYRFFTACTTCEAAVEPALKPEPQRQPRHPGKPGANKVRLVRTIVNSLYVLTMSAGGMVAGAFVIYILGSLLYTAFLRGDATGSEACARGMAVAMLSILLGAFFGTVTGSAFASRHLVMNPSETAEGPIPPASSSTPVELDDMLSKLFAGQFIPGRQKK